MLLATGVLVRTSIVFTFQRFTQLSNFVLCVKRRGHLRIINYLDDYLVVGDSYEECVSAQQCLISVLGSLGFKGAWEKCHPPSRTIKYPYLGICFNSSYMSVSLPNDKMERLHKELLFFKDKSRATSRQLQHLCGILAHASKVVREAAHLPAGL